MITDDLSQRQDIINSVKARLTPKFPPKMQPHLEYLIQSTFEYLSLSDLLSYQEDDLAGLSVSLWHHLEHWDGKKAKVVVFNPDIEQHEWQSTHTIVLVLSREMPFILDSVRIALNSLGTNTHMIVHGNFPVQRDGEGNLLGLGEGDQESRELLCYFEIDHESDSRELKKLTKDLESVLTDVRIAVSDYGKMVKRCQDLMEELQQRPPTGQDSEDVEESRVFLKWLMSNHFSFLGYDEFQLEEHQMRQVEGTALGLSKKSKRPRVESLDEMTEEKSQFLFDPQILMFLKSGRKSRIHRSAYGDYIIVKKFNEQGEVVGGYRFLGLYTSTVYNNSPRNIPVVRKKITRVLEMSDFSTGSHNYKELSQILYSFPRDELILSSVEELFHVTAQVLAIHERRQIRLFIRKDAYGKFVFAVLYIPKDIYNTRLREEIRIMLMDQFDVEGWDFTTYFSESILARTRFVFRLKTPVTDTIDVKALENKAIGIARQWGDELEMALIETLGEEKGVNLFNRYQESFPASYREKYSARVAVADIQRMEALYVDPDTSLNLSFYRSQENYGTALKLKIFHQQDSLLLSDLIPVLEHMGLKVVDEFPYRIDQENDHRVWIYDFSLLYEPDPELDPVTLRDEFSSAFINIWYGCSENDSFNRLLLKGRLSWREVAMLRAYARYMKQLRFNFSEQFIADTLFRHTDIANKLCWLFAYRFNPKHQNKSAHEQIKHQEQIEELLEAVENLSEDRILRKYAELIAATLRTNYYQFDENSHHKPYISFKFSPEQITDIPLPKPKYEIFVYSPRVEGVHLRGGKVARGGLRWSDRIEDFRTEVLGLVKAQQVKNAVIVPVGAKGGFVAKHLPDPSDREAFMAEGIACYKLFIRGLLDITDNYVDGQVLSRKQVMRYDEDDPYLVVAADKGTATFSDIANEVAIEYGHWLGDAFASGGSNGYDHKKMGITARGAWVSVQRHFRELGINVQQEEFTVVGIGDMAGDVFGNGMLQSDKTRLVAAFNHLHIFIDPSPDAEKSFAERKRLFDLPRSSWTDYNEKLISKGGGIFNRSAKSIIISPEMKKRFDIQQDRLTPTELISALLKSRVDLIWNGGIGTYVKCSSESHADVGDKANDSLRVNGRDLRARVVGEGGNLGFTQLGRVEYSLNGGHCFTDFIDNAGGVDCSDHEVNIKILLDGLVNNGDLTVKQRNNWLVKMTDKVSDLVLTNNYRQAQSLSLAHQESYMRIEEYRRFINSMESKGKLNRELEFIPDDDTISERKAASIGLTLPELAVLISYAKADLKEQLAKSDIIKDETAVKEIETAFPPSLVKEFNKSVYQHRLKTEIVATQVANDMFNHMGISYLHRLQESTGATSLESAKAYLAARGLFDLHGIWREIEALDYQVDSAVQNEMMLKTARSVRRASRWLIKNNRLGLDIKAVLGQFMGPFKTINDQFPDVLVGEAADRWLKSCEHYVEQGVSEALAARVVSSEYLYNCLGVTAVASSLKMDIIDVTKAYFELGEKLGLNDFVHQLNTLSVSSHWQARARESYRDDLEWQQRRITLGVLKSWDKKQSLDDCINQWMEQNSILVARWLKMLTEILGAGDPEFSMYSVAIRELLDLSQASMVD